MPRLKAEPVKFNVRNCTPHVPSLSQSYQECITIFSAIIFQYYYLVHHMSTQPKPKFCAYQILFTCFFFFEAEIFHWEQNRQTNVDITVYRTTKNSLQPFKNLMKEIGGFRIQDWFLFICDEQDIQLSFMIIIDSFFSVYYQTNTIIV